MSDGLGIEAVTNAVVSHALALKIFESVNQHEPKNAPGGHLTAAVWGDRIQPIRASGLNSTSVLMTFNIRIYTNMLAEPQDMIDPKMITAVDLLMDEYSGDFELGGLVRNVDLLGQFGQGLFAQAGYIKQDGKLYRIYDIKLPLVINDAWNQVA